MDPPLFLPDYAWASDPPVQAGVAEGPWQEGLRPVTVVRDPGPLPDAPVAHDDDLVLVSHPRIRTIGCYWHEGWPRAVPEAWLRRPAVDRVVGAAESLPVGFGLAIWDAWRDPRLQAILHDSVYREGSTLAPGFVAYPHSDPSACPPHASGGTLDLTLTWKLRPLSLGTRFDAFVPDAAADALEPDGPLLERDLRRLLAGAMSAAGFVGHPQEWWHWEFGTRWWAAVTGEPVRFGHARPPHWDA